MRNLLFALASYILGTPARLRSLDQRIVPTRPRRAMLARRHLPARRYCRRSASSWDRSASSWSERHASGLRSRRRCTTSPSGLPMHLADMKGAVYGVHQLTNERRVPPDTG